MVSASRTGVFLSSTYLDLRDYRHEVEETIDALAQDFHGMERFGARNPEPTQASLDEIDKCSIFVGIYAHRYGTIPAGMEKSITELEFDHATQKGLTRLCYFLDSDHPWPPRLVDTGPEAELLRKFKNKVQSQCTPAWFTSPDSLARRVQSDLHAALTARIALRIPPDSFLPVPRAPDPFFAHSYAFKQHFTGRSAEIGMLSEWLHNMEPILVLVGLGGLGKSALAYHWLQRDVLGKERLDGVVWWSFYESDATFERFARRLLLYLTENREGIRFDKFSGRDLVDSCLNLLKSERVLLVLDGAERALQAYAGLGSPYGGDTGTGLNEVDARGVVDPNFAHFLTRFSVEGFRGKLLITSRLVPSALDGLEGCRIEHLSGLKQDEVAEYFTKKGIEGSRADILELSEKCGSHPLWLSLMAGLIGRDPETPGDLARWRAKNPMPDLTGKLGHHVLQVAYEAAPLNQQVLLSRISAFRFPIDFQTVQVLSNYEAEADLRGALLELVDRELLLFDSVRARYDLHPLVRMYAYERLKEPAGLHARIVGILEGTTPPDQVSSVSDLSPVIELFHHTIRADRAREALGLFRDRLSSQLYGRFSANLTRADLLMALFPEEGADALPNVGDLSSVAWVLNALALSRARLGQLPAAISLLERTVLLEQILRNQVNEGIASVNLASCLISAGRWSQASVHLTRATSLGKASESKELRAYATKTLAELSLNMGDLKTAKRNLEDTRAYFSQTAVGGSDLGIPGATDWWLAGAQVSLAEGRRSDARSEIQSAIESAGGRKVEELRTSSVSGAISLAEGHAKEARELLQRVVDQAHESCLEIIETEARISLARAEMGTDSNETAAKHAAEAVRVATERGLVPIAIAARLVQGEALMSDNSREAIQVLKRALQDSETLRPNPFRQAIRSLLAKVGRISGPV